jgi:predicted TIM-barrel fold metal-dependent hydrolase
VDRYVIISADTHATAQPEAYAEFLESRYHDDFRESLPALHAMAEGFDKSIEDGGVFAADRLAEYRAQEGVDPAILGGTSGQWDSAQRTREQEADGVVAEVLFPNGSPFPSAFGDYYSLELQAAGKKAYNRWLAEFCADLPGRRAGIAQIPWHDIEAAVAEIEWAANAGLKGILLGFADKPLPVYEPQFEPVWAAAAAFDMPLHQHGGTPTDVVTDDARLNLAIRGSESPFFCARVFHQLIWSGVFERHPGVKFVMTENPFWVPTTLAWLDKLYKGKMHACGDLIPRSPSEYWHRQCWYGATSIGDDEVDARELFGVDKLMFGNDYPHMEATWPRTTAWLKATVGGIPEGDARRMLGENAAHVYGFDMGFLQPIADRVGPTVEELAGPREGAETLRVREGVIR